VFTVFTVSTVNTEYHTQDRIQGFSFDMDQRKNDKDSPSELSVRPFDRELLGRINAAAEFIGLSKNEFVTELLRQEMQILEQKQKEIQEWWRARVKKAKG
jgi:hypothetical protein